MSIELTSVDPDISWLSEQIYDQLGKEEKEDLNKNQIAEFCKIVGCNIGASIVTDDHALNQLLNLKDNQDDPSYLIGVFVYEDYFASINS